MSCILLHFTGWNIIPKSWSIRPIEQYLFGVSMRFQCYQSEESRHSHQRTDESQILFRPRCHLYQGKQQGTENSALRHVHQTKQVPIAILHHWLQHFVAHCIKMNQYILVLKFFHLCHIHGVCISEVHEEECQRPSRSPIWMYLLDFLHPKF